MLRRQRQRSISSGRQRAAAGTLVQQRAACNAYSSDHLATGGTCRAAQSGGWRGYLVCGARARAARPPQRPRCSVTTCILLTILGQLRQAT